ncbi:MAG: aspartate--tRNA(Asn) ligase [Bacillota bacterium]
MKRTMINELNRNIGQHVKLQGWLHRIRELGKIAFLILRDRTGMVQCIAETAVVSVKGLKLESVIEIIGEVKPNEKTVLSLEVSVTEIKVISAVEYDLPIEINKNELEASLDTILNNRVLSLRNPKVNAVFKLQAVLSQAFADYLKNNGFTQVYTSKIVSEGTEGGTEVFEIKYFDSKAYLAQSPQFYKQMLVGAGYERVFEIGHVYRAESHDTNRHLNEYVSLDVEMGFIEDEYDLIRLETALLKYMLKQLKEECNGELELLQILLPDIKDEIPCIPLPEALHILKKVYGKMDLTSDIDPEGERLISSYAYEKHGSEFVFLTHYPRAKRPMYTMPAENELTHSFDLIFRGLEITTGGQRIHSYEQLKSSISQRGLNPDCYTGYLDVFKYGMPPHGGFAIGLERLTAQLLGFKNVREATLFPRDRNRIKP